MAFSWGVAAPWKDVAFLLCKMAALFASEDGSNEWFTEKRQEELLSP